VIDNIHQHEAKLLMCIVALHIELLSTHIARSSVELPLLYSYIGVGGEQINFYKYKGIAPYTATYTFLNKRGLLITLGRCSSLQDSHKTFFNSCCIYLNLRKKTVKERSPQSLSFQKPCQVH